MSSIYVARLVFHTLPRKCVFGQMLGVCAWIIHSISNDFCALGWRAVCAAVGGLVSTSSMYWILKALQYCLTAQWKIRGQRNEVFALEGDFVATDCLSEVSNNIAELKKKKNNGEKKGKAFSIIFGHYTLKTPTE